MCYGKWITQFLLNLFTVQVQVQREGGVDGDGREHTAGVHAFVSCSVAWDGFHAAESRGIVHPTYSGPLSYCFCDLDKPFTSLHLCVPTC